MADPIARYEREAPPFSWLRHPRVWLAVGLVMLGAVVVGIFAVRSSEPDCDLHEVTVDGSQTMSMLNDGSEALTARSIELNLERDPDFDPEAVSGTSVLVCVDPADIPPPPEPNSL